MDTQLELQQKILAKLEGLSTKQLDLLNDITSLSGDQIKVLLSILNETKDSNINLSEVKNILSQYTILEKEVVKEKVVEKIVEKEKVVEKKVEVPVPSEEFKIIYADLLRKYNTLKFINMKKSDEYLKKMCEYYQSEYEKLEKEYNNIKGKYEKLEKEYNIFKKHYNDKIKPTKIIIRECPLKPGAVCLLH